MVRNPACLGRNHWMLPDYGPCCLDRREVFRHVRRVRRVVFHDWRGGPDDIRHIHHRFVPAGADVLARLRWRRTSGGPVRPRGGGRTDR
jgi:hypothetical protein